MSVTENGWGGSKNRKGEILVRVKRPHGDSCLGEPAATACCQRSLLGQWMGRCGPPEKLPFSELGTLVSGL